MALVLTYWVPAGNVRDHLSDLSLITYLRGQTQLIKVHFTLQKKIILTQVIKNLEWFGADPPSSQLSKGSNAVP